MARPPQICRCTHTIRRDDLMPPSGWGKPGSEARTREGRLGRRPSCLMAERPGVSGDGVAAQRAPTLRPYRSTAIMPWYREVALTYQEEALLVWRCSSRRARSSSPRIGCAAGLPFLARRTCNVAVRSNSTWDPARVQASIALLDRGWGKPKQTIAGDEKNPLAMQISEIRHTIVDHRPKTENG